jgi:hypothetical protein
MTIRNINPALFLAAARFASTEETRYYLRGVYVQRAATTGLLYTATCGHRLIHIHDADAEMDGDARIIGITKPKFPAAWFKVSFLLWENGVLKSDDNTLMMPAAEVDGTFPDYTRIIPATTSGETAHFNYAYLAEYEDASKKSGFGHIFVHHNGDNPALITFQEAPAIAVLMPMRADKVSSERPDLPSAAE